MKKLISIATTVIAILVLTGCGGGSTDSSGDGTTTIGVQSAVFIDSPVANLEYETSSGIRGVTTDEGLFSYINGDTITFKIGNLILGEYTAYDLSGAVTPNDIVPRDTGAQTTLLRLLQSLDADGNVSNGIYIPDTVNQALTQTQEQYIWDFNSTEEILAIDDTIPGYENVLDKYCDRDFDGIVDVNDTEALAHLEESLVKYDNGEYEGFKVLREDPMHVEDIISSAPVAEINATVAEGIAYMYSLQKMSTIIAYNGMAQFGQYPSLFGIATITTPYQIKIWDMLLKKYDIDPVTGTATGYFETPDISFIPNDQVSSYTQTILGKATTDVNALFAQCEATSYKIQTLKYTYENTVSGMGAEDIEETYKSAITMGINEYEAINKDLINLGHPGGCCEIGQEFCYNW